MASHEKKDIEKNPAAPGRSGLPVPGWVAICVAMLVAGVLVGHFLLPGGTASSTISLDGRTTLSASELDSVIATYTYDGQVNDITAREVIDQVGGTTNDDGTYNVPRANDILTYAQNALLADEAERQGLSVTDEEVSEFATGMLGTDDFATIASYYGLTEDAARQIVASSALTSKLQDSVVTTEVPDEPAVPAEPAEGEEDTPTADYAEYVIGLLGDEWDAEANTWARTDGTYYATLSGYEISNEAASYAAAEAAYNVAYEAYGEVATQASQEWIEYARGLMSKATIQIGTLVAAS